MRPRHAPLLLVLALLLAGCGSPGGARAADGDLPAEFLSWKPPQNTFLPEVLRVSALTRITREPNGAEIIACHIELRDSFGQMIKCLGVAQIDLIPGEPESFATEKVTPERTWQVDLRDPKQNAAAFDDVVTRSYRLHLGALPPALAKLADTPPGPDAPPYTLRVRFLFKDADDKARQVDAIAPLLRR